MLEELEMLQDIMRFGVVANMIRRSLGSDSIAARFQRFVVDGNESMVNHPEYGMFADLVSKISKKDADYRSVLLKSVRSDLLREMKSVVINHRDKVVPKFCSLKPIDENSTMEEIQNSVDSYQQFTLELGKLNMTVELFNALVQDPSIPTRIGLYLSENHRMSLIYNVFYKVFF